jgi:hypothetical protein
MLGKPQGIRAQEGGTGVRILVAFEKDYQVYQDVTVNIIRELRPHVEVSVAELDKLEAEVVRLEPDLVICSRPNNATSADGVLAWIKLPTGHNRSAELCLDGEYSEVEDVGLNDVLRVLDETERLAREKVRLKNR